MVLICYDGSDDAKAAIRHGGQLLRGQSATVLSVWQPVVMMATRAPTAFGFLPNLFDAEAIDHANADFALKQAQEGTELARKAGLEAEPRSCAQGLTTAEAILGEAETIDASAILMGSRGLTGLKSLLLGSVSHAVIQHADRPVIVVPSPPVALSRTHLRKATTYKHENKDRGA